jgi:hypothetical protein
LVPQPFCGGDHRFLTDEVLQFLTEIVITDDPRRGPAPVDARAEREAACVDRPVEDRGVTRGPLP